MFFKLQSTFIILFFKNKFPFNEKLLFDIRMLALSEEEEDNNYSNS